MSSFDDLMRGFLVSLFKTFGHLYKQASNLACDKLFLLVVQVLKAKVLQCDPDKAKMVLSFKAAVEGDTVEAAKPQFDCEVGKVS